mmetsp:Transcript_6672/g.18620  ORF Transcript_6672/g.18620 Transcript_6672/m.18620 type:complete len:747 (+) Transcript_6672:100-2340(+)
MRGRERPPCWTVLVGLAALHVSVQRQGMSVSAFVGTSSSSSPLLIERSGRPTISNKNHVRSIRNGMTYIIPSWRGQTTSTGPSASAAARPSVPSALFVSADIDAEIIIDNKKTDEDETEMAKEQRRRQLSQPPPQSKLRRLKDRMWVREALEDLTAADFAASLEQAAAAAEAAAADEADKDEVARRRKKKQKRAVDVENILSKLDQRVEEMCVLSTYGDTSGSTLACYPLNSTEAASPLAKEEGSTCYALKQGEGMGSVVYTDEQRDALLTRIFASRQRLLKLTGMGGADANGDVEPEASAEDLDEIRQKLKANTTEADDIDVSSSSAKAAAKAIDEKKKLLDIDPKLYVRDDGTIDWDGALQDSAALKKFGSSVWARINGQDPENIDEEAVQKEGGGHGGESKAITAKIVETDEIREKKAKLDELQKELRTMTKEHRALLNSAVDAGSAVANVNLASLDPVLRSKIRTSAEALEQKEELVSCQVLIYELERIFTYLEGELGNTINKGYIPLQDRLNVAEFGLLEAQISSFEKQLENGDYVDADVLAVVLDQVIDFKRRLGIDYYVTGLTFDKEAIQRFLADLLEKTKTGLLFYVKGVELLWNDAIYSLRLIGRALQGYTLQPREVRTLRRSFKDIITFIPFVIILIIPLSPIGHVLVFGAIQRVFPGFFPSCFTETRQNLLELYESTEYTEVVIKETWQEQVTRALQAGVFNIGDAAKQLVGGESVDETESDDDTNKSKSSEKKI